MDVIAIKRCFYKRNREPGERFSMPRNYGRQFMAARLVKSDAERRPRSYSTRVVPAEATEKVVLRPDVDDDLTALRKEYKATTGRLPHHTWSADKLREKLAFS